MQTRADAKRLCHLLVTRSVKSLGHDFCYHHRSLTVLELDLAALDLMTDVMVLDVDVLGTAMVDRIIVILMHD